MQYFLSYTNYSPECVFFYNYQKNKFLAPKLLKKIQQHTLSLTSIIMLDSHSHNVFLS